MNNSYVEKRSELTYVKDHPMTDRCEHYRIRTTCECPAPHNHRSGLLVIDNGFVLAKFVRCRSCKKGGKGWK